MLLIDQWNHQLIMDSTWSASHLNQIMAQIRLGTLRINRILCFKKAMIMKSNQGLMVQLWIILISIKVICNSHWLIRIMIAMKEDKSRGGMKVWDLLLLSLVSLVIRKMSKVEDILIQKMLMKNKIIRLRKINNRHNLAGSSQLVRMLVQIPGLSKLVPL